MGYETESIAYKFGTKSFNYDRGIWLLADAMEVEEASVLDRFEEADSELQRVRIAPKTDTFTFTMIAGQSAGIPGTSSLRTHAPRCMRTASA